MCVQKFDWITYDPESKGEIFNTRMTLIEGHPGTGKSTFIKYQVDRASVIRPALYITFKADEPGEFGFADQINFSRTNNKDGK